MGLLCQWNSAGKNTEVGCHSLLQGIFPTQESKLGLLHCRQILYHLSYQGSAICFGIWTYDAWRFCSFLRLLWIFCIFGDSIWSLRLFVFYYCKKKKKSPLGFNGDIIEFVDVFRYCEHVNNTVFQSMNTRCLSIYLYLLLFLWFIFCSFKCISIGKDVEKLEDLCTVGKNVKYCSSYEKIP